MIAPTAKPPSAGPHQPPLLHWASAVVGVATAATAMVVAALRAVRDFLMASPQCQPRRFKTRALLQVFHPTSAAPKGKPRHGPRLAGVPGPLHTEVTLGAAGATLPGGPVFRGTFSIRVAFTPLLLSPAWPMPRGVFVEKRVHSRRQLLANAAMAARRVAA